MDEYVNGSMYGWMKEWRKGWIDEVLERKADREI